MDDLSTENFSKATLPNEWHDIKEGDDFPESRNFVKALNRPLKTRKGLQDQYVALSYRHGMPLIGRVWKDMNRIQSSFTDNEKEFSGKSLGKLQLLEHMPSNITGFVYDWKPFGLVIKDSDEWKPVHFSSIVPCVLLIDQFEILGSASIKEETAQATSTDGNVIKRAGHEILNFPILCKKNSNDTMEI